MKCFRSLDPWETHVFKFLKQSLVCFQDIQLCMRDEKEEYYT